jgi:hypothetical protein
LDLSFYKYQMITDKMIIIPSWIKGCFWFNCQFGICFSLFVTDLATIRHTSLLLYKYFWPTILGPKKQSILQPFLSTWLSMHDRKLFLYGTRRSIITAPYLFKLSRVLTISL